MHARGFAVKPLSILFLSLIALAWVAWWLLFREPKLGRNSGENSGTAVSSVILPEHGTAAERRPVETDGGLGALQSSMPSSGGRTAVAVRRTLASVKTVAIGETEIEYLTQQFLKIGTEMAKHTTSIAKTTQIDSSTVHVFIPSYDEIGDGYRDRWASTMRGMLGESRWRAVEAECSGSFDLFAANFGRAVQDLQVTSYTLDGVQKFYVSRYMESSEGDEAVGRVSSFAAVYDSFELAAEDLVDGPWAYLLPVTQGLVPTTYADRRKHRK